MSMDALIEREIARRERRAGRLAAELGALRGLRFAAFLSRLRELGLEPDFVTVSSTWEQLNAGWVPAFDFGIIDGPYRSKAGPVVCIVECQCPEIVQPRAVSLSPLAEPLRFDVLAGPHTAHVYECESGAWHVIPVG